MKVDLHNNKLQVPKIRGTTLSVLNYDTKDGLKQYSLVCPSSPKEIDLCAVNSQGAADFWKDSNTENLC